MRIRRRAALIAVSAVACLSAAAVYAATSGTDETVAVPVPDAQVARYCSALHARLPEKVDGLPRHDLKPSSELTAGWGDPSIVLRCGVPRPAADDSVNTDAVEVDGVGWSIEPQGDGVFRLTTTLRKAYVEVTLPKRYARDLDPLTDLAGAVKAAVPEGI
ncbi:DUF3515 domain-containing protein [Actinacidiphila acidipaludis]|uniref:DUF3515 domain-containing protein n=1 Tax=Actinacidiphila acidipaludis TaxID=2873382 RepID=A0ABS7QFD5_9ACTN|nr:DUF3515 domain-containing protein [Streptomyces acidipaludis]MBY8881875.1 DUF3515 domain-containing protein [Streptomyces acidipaludis]